MFLWTRHAGHMSGSPIFVAAKIPALLRTTERGQERESERLEINKMREKKERKKNGGAMVTG